MQGAADRFAPGEDLYAVLELPRDASDDDVRHAYRRLARTSHPDLGSTTTDRFRRITAAYEVLGDPHRRASYDRDRRLRERNRGAVATQRAPQPSGWTDVPPAWATGRSEPEPDVVKPLWQVDDWNVLRVLSKVAVAAALLITIVVGTLVVVAIVREPEPLPGPTIFCRTPDGWLDCRRAIEPGMP